MLVFWKKKIPTFQTDCIKAISGRVWHWTYTSWALDLSPGYATRKCSFGLVTSITVLICWMGIMKLHIVAVAVVRTQWDNPSHSVNVVKDYSCAKWYFFLRRYYFCQSSCQHTQLYFWVRLISVADNTNSRSVTDNLETLGGNDSVLCGLVVHRCWCYRSKLQALLFISSSSLLKKI
jgi:hypothetical protein